MPTHAHTYGCPECERPTGTVYVTRADEPPNTAGLVGGHCTQCGGPIEPYLAPSSVDLGCHLRNSGDRTLRMLSNGDLELWRENGIRGRTAIVTPEELVRAEPTLAAIALARLVQRVHKLTFGE